MHNQENYKEDILSRYMSPGKSEKAPVGFTSKIMTRIHLETIPIGAEEKLWKRYVVPLISVAVTIILICSAFLLSGNKSDISDSTFLNYFRDIKSALPDVNLSSIFRLSVPSVLIYAVAGIFMLTLFDRALYSIFKRAK